MTLAISKSIIVDIKERTIGVDIRREPSVLETVERDIVVDTQEGI